MDAVTALLDTLGPDVVRTSVPQREAYQFDRARAPGAALPEAAVLPRTVEQVQDVMRWATEHRVPVVPRTAGTGISGGASGVRGGIVLSLERFLDVDIDPDTRTVWAGAGVVNADLKAAVAEHGLWYPPDPGSVEISSIGGNVATNAGGLCCVKYGVTSDYVRGLEVVLADGRVVTLGGPQIKDVAGLRLTQLMVGSEGTLGIITKVLLALEPAQKAPSTLVATFATVRDAADAVVAMKRTVSPSMLELIDNECIRAVEDVRPMGLDREAAAMLLIQSDADVGARSAEIDAIRRACESCHATDVVHTDDPQESAMFVASRRAVFPAVERLGAFLLEDIGATVPKLPELMEGVARIAADLQLRVPVVAHAGDGNIHPVVVYDPADDDARGRAQDAFERLVQLAHDVGGTITGEHGVGRVKRPYLEGQLGPDVMELHRGIKAVFDPLGILNPGAGY